MRIPDQADGSIACLSPNGGTVTESQRPPDTLIVATVAGVYALETNDAERSWHVASTTLPELHVSAVLHEPRSGHLFAATHDGGLFVSFDRAATWQRADAGIAHKNVYTLAVQYRSSGTVLFAGTEPARLYRSDDLGETWRELPALKDVPNADLWTFPPPPYLPHVKNIAFHPTEPETLYVCIEQGALLKSIDDGATWFEVESYAEADDKFRHDVHRTLVAPSDPHRLLLATGEGIYRSFDAGVSWEHVTRREHRIGYPDAAFIDPIDDRVVYIGGPADPPGGWKAQLSANATVQRSLDFGTTWEEWRTGMPGVVRGNIEAMGLHRAGSHVTLFAGTATGEVYCGEHAGARWSLAAQVPPISKAHHYRNLLNPEERAAVEAKMHALIGKVR